MKILCAIEGFVTNSSSANYWLNDGVLTKVGATPSDQKTNTVGSATIPFQDLLMWLAFSAIVIAVFFLRGRPGFNAWLKRLLGPKTLPYVLMLLFVIFYNAINYLFSHIGFFGIFVDENTSWFYPVATAISLAVAATCISVIVKRSGIVIKLKYIKITLAAVLFLVFIISSVNIYFTAYNKWKITMGYITEEHFPGVSPKPIPAVVMVERLVKQERSDLQEYTMHTFRPAFQKMWFISFFIFVSAHLLLFAVDTKRMIRFIIRAGQ